MFQMEATRHQHSDLNRQPLGPQCRRRAVSTLQAPGKLILQSPYLQIDEDAYASSNVCGKTRMGKNKHQNTRVPVPHSLSIKKAISAAIVFIISIASRLDMRFPSLCFTLLLLYRT